MAEDYFISKRVPCKALLMNKHSIFQIGFIVKKKKMTKRKITICIHYFRSSSYEESKAHLFPIKAPASPSPGESGELQRQGEIRGTEMKALPRSNPSLSDLEGNLVISPSGSRE